jgi:hypothetical protein
MAKIISPFVGSAKGKLGGAVYYTRTGGTFARQRVATVANPKTDAQLVTRVILSTASKAYRLFAPLSNHAFQDMVGKAQNHQAFMKANANMLRAAEKYGAGGSVTTGFNAKGDESVKNDPFIISDGSLPSVDFKINSATIPGATGAVKVISLQFPVGDNGVTYQAVADALGVPAGTEVTFAVAFKNATKNELIGLEYARVILMPSSGLMTEPFLANGGTINEPNSRNEGTDSFLFNADVDAGYGILTLTPKLVGTADKTFGSAAVILSNNDGGRWMRSPAKLIPAVVGADAADGINEAVASYRDGATSSRYLNQSRLGGGGTR